MSAFEPGSRQETAAFVGLSSNGAIPPIERLAIMAQLIDRLVDQVNALEDQMRTLRTALVENGIWDGS